MGVFKPVDYRGTAGTMLRGKNVYGAGGRSPNPKGINLKRAATQALKMMKGKV